MVTDRADELRTDVDAAMAGWSTPCLLEGRDGATSSWNSRAANVLRKAAKPMRQTAENAVFFLCRLATAGILCGIAPR